MINIYLILDFVSPVLELDLQNIQITNQGLVLCLSVFSSGTSTIYIKLRNDMEDTKISLAFKDCLNLCQVFLRIDGQSFRFTQLRSNSWIFLCLSYDPVKQEISLGLDNTIAFSHKIENSRIKFPASVEKLDIWWENIFDYTTFPDKFTQLNIHSNQRSVDKFLCGEPGDLYAWSVAGWNSRVGDRSLAILTSQESTYQTCQAHFQVYSIPGHGFYDAMTMCREINGNLFFEDTVFQELILLEEERLKRKKIWWIPYTDDHEEGVFRNVYTNSTFNNITEYYTLGEPNGGTSQSCLIWFLGGLWDGFCTLKEYSLCKIPKNKPSLVLRGLCLESQVERIFTSGNDNGRYIWKGNRYASIQYTDRWLLQNIENNARAESEASYESLLIGTHSWTIHNDKICFGKEYIANLSLRCNIP